jgi:hypothetical protein
VRKDRDVVFRGGTAASRRLGPVEIELRLGRDDQGRVEGVHSSVKVGGRGFLDGDFGQVDLTDWFFGSKHDAFRYAGELMAISNLFRRAADAMDLDDKIWEKCTKTGRANAAVADAHEALRKFYEKFRGDERLKRFDALMRRNAAEALKQVRSERPDGTESDVTKKTETKTAKKAAKKVVKAAPKPKKDDKKKDAKAAKKPAKKPSKPKAEKD